MSTQPAHILIMNHDQDLLDAVAALLEDDGYRTSTHAHSNGDFEFALALAPDLIVLDYIQGVDQTRWALLETLRTDPRTESIPLVLCTGASSQMRELGESLDALGVTIVLKPFDIDLLSATIADLLANRSPAERDGVIAPKGVQS